MKKGLILEGGAMRGLFTAGVMDVLMESGITFDGAAGTSAGAAFGSNYKSRQIGRAVRYNLRFRNDPRYHSLQSLLRSGDLYNADFCYNTLPYELDVFDTEAFKASPMEFYAVCTDIETGKAHYHRCIDGLEKDMAYIRASASMPMVSRPVEIDGRKYLDGGAADSIPLLFMETMGYDRNVVILTQPRDFTKQPNSLLPLLRVALKDYPAMVKALENRHIGYNRVRKYIFDQMEKGKLFVIMPPVPLDIGAVEHEADEIKRVYMIGVETGYKCYREVKKFLEE